MNIELEILEIKKRLEKIENLLNIKNLENVELTFAQKPTKSGRDKTKYVFNNRVLPKNRLVLEVVREYVRKNNPSFDELQNVFHKSLQGSLNVVETVENASKISDCEKRYFMNSPLNLKYNTQAVVCTQWGIFNIVKFEKLASDLGFKIDKISY